MTAYSPPAHRMTVDELRAQVIHEPKPSCGPYMTRCGMRHPAPVLPTVSPWVRNAIAGTLPAPTLAPTQAEIDAELHERFRFAFRVR